MVPSLVDVASSAELLGRLTVANDRAKPVSSNIAHARTSATDAAATTVEAKHISSVKRLYVAMPLKDIDRVSTAHLHDHVLPSGILILCDECNLEGLRSATWVSGWEHPLRRPFECAITPDKLTTTPLTTLVGEGFGQVSRTLEDGASDLRRSLSSSSC